MRFDEEWVLIDKDGRRRLHGVPWMLCVLAVVASAIAPAQASEAPRMAPPPAWVIADAVSDKVPGASGLRYALVSDQVDLTGAAPQAYRRLSYTVQRAKSLDEAGQISIDYQPQYQQLALNSLEVWRDGRRIDMRTQAHYARLRRESGLEEGLIDGALTLSITLPDLRVGDRVDYGVTITGSNPVFGKGYYDVFDALRRTAGRAPGARAVSRRDGIAVAGERARLQPQRQPRRRRGDAGHCSARPARGAGGKGHPGGCRSVWPDRSLHGRQLGNGGGVGSAAVSARVQGRTRRRGHGAEPAAA
ncbi:hypothetical protein FHY16_002114 [Xanthomonas campestris]|nr:hypothetical protein [Xanthomonas euroxanthea]